MISRLCDIFWIALGVICGVIIFGSFIVGMEGL
jgi:hypothetical protein